MKFVITVNVETVESYSGPHTPIAGIILTALPMILDALNIKPQKQETPEEPSSDTQPPSSL